MYKIFAFLMLIVPLGSFAQATISGRVLSGADNKPVASASVFLSNATVGTKTGDDGKFVLTDAKPGKYKLVISIIGFETYHQPVTVNDDNIILPDIVLSPKTTALKEVTIKYHDDPDRDRYYGWFKDEFIGTSKRADECKIINPEALNLAYDKKTHVLTASSQDFLEIENQALGYKLKYLLTNFTLDNDPHAKLHISYEGAVLFEEMKGTSEQEKEWRQNREAVYRGSTMHFLRSAHDNRIDAEGFKVYRIVRKPNPQRPPDSLIEAKIAFYKNSGPEVPERRDSLSFWKKKSALQTMLEKLSPEPLTPGDFINLADKQDLFEFGFGNSNDALYVSYDKNHRFDSHLNNYKAWLNDANNKENTRVDFDAPYAFFDLNGAIVNPASLVVNGAWAKNRVAELLPVDYQPAQNENSSVTDTASGGIGGKLAKFLANHPTEKAYLQFDKPYYAAGDTIYFKAYVTEGEQHKLSALSGVLHVDMINTKDKIDQSILLQLDSGIARGDFALPDSLPGGNYRIRAYTQLMRNNNETGFFDKVIPVASLKTTKIPESLVKQPGQPALKPDIQFLPEGGSMVAGVRSKVAFKAVGADGLGIDVKGSIVDNDHKQVASFASAHLGMGYFYLTPEPGKTYTAKVNYTGGQVAAVSLPEAEPLGITLTVDNDSIPKASVRIAAGNEYYRNNRGKDYKLVIYSGGFVTTANCKLDSPVIKLDILKRKLHTGIATVTLFSPQNEPLCERLLFIQNYDQLSLDVKSDKETYTKRENVNIKLNALNRKGDPAEGHFSVSVTDESLVPDDENNSGNILTDLLLTSALKGYIEQPNYYFADTSTAARENLDILMLTQGYRRFTWKQVLDSAAQPLAYLPEKGITIAGRVNNLFNKPVANGTIALLPSKGGPVLSAATDAKGMFRFSNLVFADTTHFVLSAVNSKNKNSTMITYFNDKKNAPAVQKRIGQQTRQISDTTMTAYVENDKIQQRELLNNGKGRGIMLKQVNIHEKKSDDQYRTQSLAGAGFADQVMHADEIEQIGGLLSTSLNGRLRGVTFINGTPVLTLSSMMGMGITKNKDGSVAANRNPSGMLVIIDGNILNGVGSPPNIDFLNVNSVETVEVLKYASVSIYGAAGGNGVLIITTKQGGGLDAKDIASIGVLPITPKGFYKAREFYSPKYDNVNLTGKQPDLRSTIYWKPELITDKNGNASFDFYNADVPGIYKMVIEGIDKDGNIGRQVYRYKVD